MPHRLMILLFSLIALPWYWSFLPLGWAMIPVAGLPMWAFVAMAGSFGVSVHTAMVFMKPWEIEDDDSRAEKESS